MHSSRYKFEICLISTVQPTNRTTNKTKKNKKTKKSNPQTNSISKNNKISIFFNSFIRNSIKKPKYKRTSSNQSFFDFSHCFSTTKQLTWYKATHLFFFSFQRPRRLKELKACCGLINSFGEGDECEIVETQSGDRVREQRR